MKKLLLIFTILFFASTSFADLKVTWFGTTCVLVSDGETSLFFDPFITRPSIWDFITFKGFDSDKENLTKWLPKVESDKIKAVFVSHTHYDHVLDLPEILKRTKARAYGSFSVQNLVEGAGLKKSRAIRTNEGGLHSVGKFTVKVLKGSHPPHFMGYMFMSGRIEKPLKLPASGYSFKKDEEFAFYIQHPEGNILFHPSGNTSLTPIKASALKADLVLLGIAKRDSTEGLLNKVVAPTEAKTVIPLHYDNFFKPLDEPLTHLYGVNLKEFNKTLFEKSPLVKVVRLGFGKSFVLKK